MLLPLFLATTLAAVNKDRVSSLPGFEGDLPSAHYSGYIDVGATSGEPGSIHYWLIEAEEDPANAPTVYWTNGGPGSSGISVGLLTISGQVSTNERSFAEAGEDGLKLFYNPYGWSRRANMVFVSQPKGVGYSYCANASNAAECRNDDLTAAEDAIDFFEGFFAAYPELAKNDFYLASESYGGVYLPLFMKQIKDRTAAGEPPLFNFKGALIGNGAWGSDSAPLSQSPEWKAKLFFGASMIDEVLFDEIVVACSPWTPAAVGAAECRRALALMNDRTGSYNTYNIYDTCVGPYGDGSGGSTFAAVQEAMAATAVITESCTDASPHPQLTGGAVTASGRRLAALNDYACGSQEAAEAWLGQANVKAALHVADSVGQIYTKSPAAGDLRELYKELIGWTRILIFSGDTDACIPAVGTLAWTRELGYAVRDEWHPWTAAVKEGGALQRAGYAINYETATDFSVVTVQGAGHEVSRYKRGFGLALFERFLDGEPF